MKAAGNIRSVYLRTSVDRVIQGALVILAAGLVLGFWVLCRGQRRTWRVAVVLALALITLGVRTLSEDTYRQHLTAVLWTLVLAGLAMLAWDALKATQARLAKNRA
jgi:hypothetical protein